ncbi:MAG: single-stranded DNA-binding protein [Chitinophagaceae bacterium]|nr:single-stranded DNA-binding protein [Chitinophagaceae bacterium]
MIKLQVIGNLGKDCLTNQVNGKNVINFSVAHTERYRDSAGVQKDKTTWVECAYWTDRTGIAPYLRKGTQVYVEGTPEIRTFTRSDGTTGSSLSLRVMSVQLLGSRTEQGADGNMGGSAAVASGGNGSYGGRPEPVGSMDLSAPDDLPF